MQYVLNSYVDNYSKIFQINIFLRYLTCGIDRNVEIIDTNDTFLEPSKSAASTKDTKKDNKKNMSDVALTQVSVAKKNITSKEEKRNKLENTESEDENEEMEKNRE